MFDRALKRAHSVSPDDVLVRETSVVAGTLFATVKTCSLSSASGAQAMDHIRTLILSVAFVFVSLAGVDAKAFRYAYRIDPASLDPHALAETFTLSWLGQVYEPLVGRGK